VSVVFSDGQTAPATVIGTDERTDLAVIQVEDVSDLTPATFGASSEMLVGDTVLAIGSPLGFQGSVTQGIVSALDRTLGLDDSGDPFGGGGNRTSLSGLIQTDASINPGNSGGALVNMAGEVIGINTAIATSGSSGNIGVGFAIPSNRATQVVELLISGAEVPHPFLGVSVVTAEGGGALVGDLVEDSPADEAGLRAGDIITHLGDRPVADSNDLVSAVQSGEVGAQLEVRYERDGVEQTTTVTLGEADD
jgi:putative serine protease PepD